MGFSVSCDGADLLDALKKSEDGVFGRRFPLYVIALATGVDDAAIKWLSHYGRELDSLTGEFIAFIVFFNSARFRASSTSTLGAIDVAGTEEVFRYKLSSPTGDVSVPPEALLGSWALRQHVRGTMKFPNEAFVSSMTYQSDLIARQLGISPTDLPCLLFLDDPNANAFYTLPMKELDSLFQTLRSVVGKFYSDQSSQEYFSLLRMWDEQQAMYMSANADPLSVEILFQQRDHGIACKMLKRWSNKYVDPKWRSKLASIASSTDVALRRLQKCLDVAAATGEQSIDFERFYRRTMRHLLSNDAKLQFRKICASNEVPKEQWQELLRTAISPNNPVRQSIRTNAKLVNQIIEEYLEPYRAKSLAAERRLEQLENELDRVERPSIGPILKSVKWAKRRGIGKSTLRVRRQLDLHFSDN